MSYFAVQYLYRADADVAAVRPEHRAYLATLVEAGQLKVSGPYVGTERDSALLIFEAADADTVQGLIDADPMALRGVLESSSITQWNPVLGGFA
ncbi:MAG: YciI family protein [Brooklawnia sp.]|uniref:YciI family protein n=1 Tax=Brooklawnia sp. TaxID=2699740 RepID=UPI003C75D9E3